MTRRDHRVWLISVLSVAVVGWAAAAGTALLPTIYDADVSAHGIFLLFMWVLAVPVPATFGLVAWHRQSIALQKSHKLGQRHAQLIDGVHAEMSHRVAMLS